MSEQLKIEAMARVDSREYSDYWEQDGVWWASIDGNIGRIRLPNYFDPIEGHGHIQRVIDGLSPNEFHQYCKWVGGLCLQWDIHPYRMTPAQKVGAILKTKGLWTKEME